MVKKISFEGFKSLLSDVIELGGLTLLTGINSSGKSSVDSSDPNAGIGIWKTKTPATGSWHH